MLLGCIDAMIVLESMAACYVYVCVSVCQCVGWKLAGGLSDGVPDSGGVSIEVQGEQSSQ